jgi:hypothetical protein
MLERLRQRPEVCMMDWWWGEGTERSEVGKGCFVCIVDIGLERWGCCGCPCILVVAVKGVVENGMMVFFNIFWVPTEATPPAPGLHYLLITAGCFLYGALGPSRLQRMVCDSCCWCHRHSVNPIQELEPAVFVAHQELLGASGWIVDRSLMFGFVWLRSFAARNAAWPEARLCIRSSFLPAKKNWGPLGNRNTYTMLSQASDQASFPSARSALSYTAAKANRRQSRRLVQTCYRRKGIIHGWLLFSPHWVGGLASADDSLRVPCGVVDSEQLLSRAYISEYYSM